MTDRDKALKTVDTVAKLLDSQFKIPGTEFRFGLDAVAGLIPVGGDAVSFLASGALVLTMVRHGASGQLAARMLGNIAIDAIVGSVPFVGDLFDVAFKANVKNVELLKEHYDDGKHSGSGWGIFFATSFALLLMGAALAWLLLWMGGLLLSVLSLG
ncbi:MAG: DUF4112 domain-containing protein [Saprospiraceae bacterium]